MAVTAHELHWNGSTGSVETGDKREYTAVYRVFTDDAADQANVIIAYFQASVSLPFIGSTYAYANDVNSLAICTRIRPRRPAGSDKIWEVTVTFRTPGENDEGQDENGDPVDDPLLFHNKYQVGFAQFTRPAEKGVIHTPLPKIGRPAGSEGPLVNSANIPFIPPFEMDDSHRVVRITKNLPEFDGQQATDYQDAINTDVVVFNNNFYKYDDTWQPFQAKIQSIGGAFTLTNNIRYWEVTYEVHVNRNGWRVELLDQGVNARAQIGDKDGKGGTVQSADVPPPGVPQLRAIVDKQGNPIREPVPFDGDGQPLPPGDPTVYLTYAVYDELPFAALNLDQ